MLFKEKQLKNYQLHALDGEIGKPKDFYFDDRYWTVRYLVADTGNWLVGRKVLISPYAITGINMDEERIDINLNLKQIEDSPPIEADKPVSKQYENTFYGFYGWPVYWYGPHSWGSYYRPPMSPERMSEIQSEENKWDPNLRSADEVRGYDIMAKDGDIGHVEDFLIDDTTWAIRYLVIDTRDFLPGKKVLLSPEWSKDIVWTLRQIEVRLDRDTIKQAPEYTDDTRLTREYEQELCKHYQREGYWTKETPVA